MRPSSSAKHHAAKPRAIRLTRGGEGVQNALRAKHTKAGAVAAGFRCVGYDIVDMCELCNMPRPDNCELINGTKQGGDWFGANCESSISRLYGSKSPKRKRASALIAKIPLPLSSYIARAFLPHP